MKFNTSILINAANITVLEKVKLPFIQIDMMRTSLYFPVVVKIFIFQLLLEILFIGISVEGYLIRTNNFIYKGTETLKRTRKPSCFEIPVLQNRFIISDSFLPCLRASSTEVVENQAAYVL